MDFDREMILRALADWNVWWKGEGVPGDIKGRKRELKLGVAELLSLRAVKTVTGIRRCGKSTYMYQMIDYLLEGGAEPKAILFANFDDETLSSCGLSEIIDAYRSRVYPKERFYLFLDEIHRCGKWVSALRKLYDLKTIHHTFITDSSSRFIKGEYATILTGRTMDINMLPLSFREYASWRDARVTEPLGHEDVSHIKHLLDSYLRWGGYPEVVLTESELHKKIILGEYVDSIIYRDIIERYHANPTKVRTLVDYLVSNPASFFSPRRFSRRHDISLDTINNYMNYLHEVYLIYEVPKFDYSLNKVLQSRKKVYLADTGIFTGVGFKYMDNQGKLYENAVFLELMRQGYDVYYWSTKDSECDFLLKKGEDLIGAVQVTFRMGEDNVQRELRGLKDAMAEFDLEQGVIVTSEIPEEKTEDENVSYLPLWRFLLSGDFLGSG